MKKIPLAAPTMHGEEQKYIQEAFDTNWVSPLGPNVDAFEREIAAYAGTSASAALSSGTAALHLSVILAGVKEEDIFNRGLCLPSDIKNTEEDMQRIIQIVRRQFGV